MLLQYVLKLHKIKENFGIASKKISSIVLRRDVYELQQLEKEA
jgi:hypothetical protein